jgi:hypothetical protein
MPWENVGGCGDGQIPDQRGWVLCQLELGIRYLRCVCGEPPKGYELDVMWHEHDTCSYPSIGIRWEAEEAGSFDAPSEYIERCRLAVEAFDGAVSWAEINPQVIQEQINDEIGVREDADENSEGESVT